MNIGTFALLLVVWAVLAIVTLANLRKFHGRWVWLAEAMLLPASLVGVFLIGLVTAVAVAWIVGTAAIERLWARYDKTPR